MQYVARQPILDANRQIKAFELLFRNSEENRCPESDADLASKTTMDTAILLGLDTLCEGHDLFLNCTHDLIVGGFPTLLPPDLTFVEVLESVQPTTGLVDALRDLKSAGYRIALDDFVPQRGYEPLIELADVIKVDFRATTPPVWAQFSATYLAPGRQLLAEKVETEDEFQAAVGLGYGLFQGYLFSKPSILSTSSLANLHPNQLRIIRLLASPSIDFVELEAAIKSDPALCYRLLKLLNSSAFYLRTEIRSVLHALTLLGEVEVRKWMLLVCAVLGSRGKKSYLLTTALVRARFAELIGNEARLSGPALFILGLLSLMDAILDVPMSMIVDQVAVSVDIRAALEGLPNPLRSCLDLVLCYETADWSRCDHIRKQWRIPAHTMSNSYIEAVRWAGQITGEYNRRVKPD